MLTLIFYILLFVVFIRLIVVAVRAAWGIARVLLFIIFLPVVLIALTMAGLVVISLPILAIGGLISLAE